MREVQARKIFKQANKILKRSGGDHSSFFGIDVPYFDTFESIDIRKYHEAGIIPRDRITIKTDDTIVFFAEKTGISFETIKYTPGNWENILTDETFF